MGGVFGAINEETPKFELVRQNEVYEIRKYHPCMRLFVIHFPEFVCWLGVAIETSYSASEKRQGQSNGFRDLAAYIGVLTTPQNESRQGIAMTAPVVTTNKPAPEAIAMTAPVVTSELEGKDDVETMAFILPSKYQTVESAPVPTNPRVTLRQLPERFEAVHRFYGYAEMNTVDEQVKKLQSALEKDGIKITGKWLLSRYNSPFTLWWLRTNEVSFPVEEVRPDQ